MSRVSTLLFLLAVPAVPVAAQMAWDGPSLVGPTSPVGLSLFVLEPDPGAGVGVLATFRHDAGAIGLGYRAAIGQGAGDDPAISAGIDVSGVLTQGIEDAEVDVIWWTGAGAGIGDDLSISIPIGLAAGWTGAGGDAVFSPYLGGHMTVDVSTDDGDHLDLNAAVDLGMDMELDSGWIIRFGASVGGRNAFALGVRLPGAGGPLVRN